MCGHGRTRSNVRCLILSEQAFESTLKSWEDKQKCDSCKPVLRSPLYPQQAVELATEEEASQIQLCSQAAEILITRYREAHCYGSVTCFWKWGCL